jgi:hypothetical protein
MTREDRVDVHLGEIATAVIDNPPREHLEISDGFGGVRATVSLDEADDDVGAAISSAMPFTEHGERLANAWGRAEVDAQRSPRT